MSDTREPQSVIVERRSRPPRRRLPFRRAAAARGGQTCRRPASARCIRISPTPTTISASSTRSRGSRQMPSAVFAARTKIATVRPRRLIIRSSRRAGRTSRTSAPPRDRRSRAAPRLRRRCHRCPHQPPAPPVPRGAKRSRAPAPPLEGCVATARAAGTARLAEVVSCPTLASHRAVDRRRALDASIAAARLARRRYRCLRRPAGRSVVID